MSHGHGRVECSECKKVITSCRCLKAGEAEVKYEVCVYCKNEASLREQKRTQEFNRKLREMGLQSERPMRKRETE